MEYTAGVLTNILRKVFRQEEGCRPLLRKPRSSFWKKLEQRGKKIHLSRPKQGNTIKATKVYGATDVGRQRERNEDCYLLLPKQDIYIVADGMGGYNAGDVASLNAVQAMNEYFTPELISEMRADQSIIQKSLVDAVMTAHERIMEMSKTNAEWSGMGSTVAISFIHDSVLHTCHVGDSRVYVITPTAITQITRDHSTVAELVRMGEISRDDARHSHIKNEITQAIGILPTPAPEYNRTYRLKEEDMVLLCSDGLWDMLTDREIHKVIIESSSLEEACNELIKRANAFGGEDNVTVVLVRMNGNESSRQM